MHLRCLSRVVLHSACDVLLLTLPAPQDLVADLGKAEARTAELARDFADTNAEARLYTPSHMCADSVDMPLLTRRRRADHQARA